MIAALIALGLFSPFAIMVACFCGQHWRLASAFMRHVMRRRTVCDPIRRSLLSPATGSDWCVTAGIRIEASNEGLKSKAWAYDFSEEAHLFHDGTEIKLSEWEQYMLNRALRSRAKLVNKEKALALRAANDQRILQLAEGICRTYGRP